MEASSTAASRCFMFMYFLFPHWVPATWRNLAETSIRAELSSGKLPTTRVRRRISRFNLSITLISTNTGPMLAGEIAAAQSLRNAVLYFLAASFNFIARSSSTTALAFSRAAFLFSWAWIALNLLATSFTLERGVMENTLR